MKVIMLSLTIVLLVTASLFCTVTAQSRVPGVSVGNNFKYKFNFDMNTSNSTNNNFSLPSLFEGLLEQAKNIDYLEVSITQIAGSKVTAEATMQFKNGTSQTSTDTIDVATGQDSSQQGSVGLFLIASNLKAGDQLYSTGVDGTINDTVTRSYPSGTREVNHQNIIMDYTVDQNELAGFGISAPLQQTNVENIYWDRQTGALVEMTYNMTSRSQEINAEVLLNVALVESNVYTVPEFPVTTLLLAVLAFSTVVLLGVRRLRPKTFFSFCTTRQRMH